MFANLVRVIVFHLNHHQMSLKNHFDLIFIYVWGLAPQLSINGFCYYIIFIDDFSRFIWLFPIKAKFDILSTFLYFKCHVKNHFNHKIKFIQLDYGGNIIVFTLT